MRYGLFTICTHSTSLSLKMVPKWCIEFLHVIVAQKTLYFVVIAQTGGKKVLFYWQHINLTHNLPKHFIYSRDLGVAMVTT